MADLPAPISEFIETLSAETIAPGYLFVTDNDGLTEWGGALEEYGITGLQKNMQVETSLDFLIGILPLDSGSVFLPNVQTQDGVFADIYVFQRDLGTWVLFLDATADVKRRQVMQQRTYDISLHATQLEQEGKSLYDANSILELRVREQTSELSETVLRLQQELADGRKIERALSNSESRFRSLYDCKMLGIVFWDGDGKVTDANEAFLSLLGYSKDDVARGAIEWHRITGSQQSAAAEDLSEETIDTLNSRPYEQQFVRKDGSALTLLFGSNPVEGSADKRVGFALDTSLRSSVGP